MSRPLRYGLIGCGSFGRFCLSEYQRMPELECVAVADVDPALAEATAETHRLACESTPAALLRRGDIDLVHLATPPSTHATLATEALAAGKHVLCEKPLALTLADADLMLRAAARARRLLAVNLIMRYNPLCAAIKSLVDGEFLGAPLFASFANAAQDETLPATHWFWDPARSGGIFIEHGVHFFDLFEWWFGKGTVVSAQQIRRPGTLLVDQVHCAVRYGEATLGTFYHGFHQMLRRDNQAWRLVFELGVITLSEWVPTRMEMDVTVGESTLAALVNLVPKARVEILERYEGSARNGSSRHRERLVDVHAGVTADFGPKRELYGEMIRNLMRDQLQAIAEPGHTRLVDDTHGLSSLSYAVAARELSLST